MTVKGTTVSYWTRSYFRRKKSKEKSWRVGAQPEKIFLQKVRNSLGKNLTLLDIGCGDGSTVKSIANRVREAYGVDAAPRLLEIARKGAPPNVHFKKADARRLPFPSQYFDRVICQRGPATENKEFAREMARVLKRGGKYIGIHIGERDKENIKRIFKRGQLYRSFVRKKSEAGRQIALLKELGFRTARAEELNPTEYFATLRDLIARMKRVPMIPHFNRTSDKYFLGRVQKELTDEHGIRTNSHRVIISAAK